MPFAVVFVRANILPSGDQLMLPMRALAGNASLISFASASVRIVTALTRDVECGPLVLGLMRKPASRNIGSDKSAMEG